jgi:fatty-acid desaturase
MNLHTKVKLNILAANVVAVVGVAFFFSWWGLGLAFITWLLFNLGVSGGFHRLFSHKQYKVSRPFAFTLLMLGSLAGIGSCVSWVGQHRRHHAFSDVKGKDPYYPHDGLIRAWVFGPWNINIPPLSVKDLLKDKTQMFFHHNYFKIQMLWVALLFAVNPVLVFWLWALPSAGTFFSLQVVGVLGHIIGKQEFDTHDSSLNSHVLNLFTFGESYQNSHHHNASQLVLGKYDVMGKFLDMVRTK